MDIKKTTMPQNYKKDIDWIIDAYELAGVKFSDGFQKDAIQNASGARKRDTWIGWKCKIDLIKNSHGVFLVIEDEGTEGLTGPNISSSEIMEIIDREENIDIAWRLARFSSRNVSGGDQTGAGKYGVGKSVYSACSSNYDYCFDSLRSDGVYVANRNEAGQIFERAYEGDEAKAYIFKITGLHAKETVGTRIIIINPKDEICDSISSGEIASYIQESWWRNIMKMPDDAGIYLNGTRISVPDFEKPVHSYEMERAELFAPGFRVKKFGFYITNKESQLNWRGISYYRKGMKIGYVDIADLPNSIKDKFWGYIEVDKEWEDLLAEIEDAVHYGVAKHKKHTITYKNMRRYIQEKVMRLLMDWGYIKDHEQEDRKLQEALKEISAELHDLFDKLGFEDIGKGAKKPDFNVRLKGVKYPHFDSAIVSSGDEISFGFAVSNEYLTDRKFEFSVDIVSHADNQIVSSFDGGSFQLNAGETFERKLSYIVSSSTAHRYEENRIVLTVRASGSTKQKRKEIPFFFDTENEDKSRREVILSLHSKELPNEESRRVNYGDHIRNIKYLVENKRNYPLSFRINVSLHNCEDPTNPKIIDVGSVNGYATPNEELVIHSLPDLYFDQQLIEQHLESGVMEIRARLIATEDSGEYEKGDKITHYYYKVYLNQDEKSGKDGSFEPRTADEPQDYRRSWCKGGSRLIYINSGHPAYKVSQDDEYVWKNYMKQEMTKQYVLLYLEEGKYSMFGKDDEIATMDPIEANRRIMDKVEEIYQRSFR